MKKTILIAMAIMAACHLYANTVTISVQNFSFSPSGATIHLGDTLLFKWISGNHTTTSTAVPAGAATWDSPMNSTDTTFMYVPSRTGTYLYECTFHASMGMIDSFFVLPPSGVPCVQLPLFSVSPNPVHTTAQVHFVNATQPVTVTINDVTGKEIEKQVFKSTPNGTIDCSGIPNGIYLIKAEQNGIIYTKKITVTH